MKHTHRCPKCQSLEVLKVAGSIWSTTRSIAVNNWETKKIALDRYICFDCGYTEEYAVIDDNLRKWARKRIDKQDFGGDFV